MRLNGKIALITGAASGFGEGIAKRFAAEGAKVVIADLNAEGARRVAAEAGPNAYAVSGDVSREGDVQAMVDAALQHFGGLDIVVNNAGTTHKNQPLLEVDEATFDRVYAVNVKSIFWMAKAAVPVLRRQGRGGSIINISSTAGIRPRPGLVWYNGSKGAVNTITAAMAIELASDNIRVNAVCPVIGATGLLEQFMGLPDTPENRARFIATIPLGRMSTPADIANACVFLAEDASAFITGVLLPVDGGRCA
ncbi:MAG: SDR family oxidoreductase [Acidobacteriia bacterium]|nr:SDR family oxidoreductase [Methyloceanibacter sp.]MCL6490566.1 SDR family oxidoreductase [Terriglobia bacterium]